MLSSECPMPSMGGVYREGRGAILRITLYASYQVPPSHLLATFVVTCTARIYLPSLLHACMHTFTTSSYTSNYLVCILPGCYLINKRATPLQRYQFGVRQILATEARLCHHHLPIGPTASAASIASDQHQRNFTSSLIYYRKSLVKSRLKSNYLSLYILYIDIMRSTQWLKVWAKVEDVPGVVKPSRERFWAALGSL
jgi:hypothetical protein